MTFAIFCILSFIAGVLVGRHNPKIASSIDDVVERIRKNDQ